jgi:hypothetical protein
MRPLLRGISPRMSSTSQEREEIKAGAARSREKGAGMLVD